MQVQYLAAVSLPDDLAVLLDTDAIILANVDCGSLTFQQQEMLCRYVNDLGGGLIMTGGPNTFGAGGWIGSPVAQILPVDLDPPQKKQLPKGALALIMHACEMPQGNYWGKKVAASAVGTLSRLDLVGILAYDWQGGSNNWVRALGPVGDKDEVIAAIEQMQMGDMPSLHDLLQQAYDALVKCDAAQKHVIVITDGDPAPPTQALLDQLAAAKITCTGVCIWPHSPASKQNLQVLAQSTGGRYYDVTDPAALPQIFIKEAQVVRRALIVEEPFTPQISFGLSEILKGVTPPLPNLDGYVLTGAKGGLNQLVLATHQADPLLATCQSGLGRCVVFTSSADSRWAGQWLQWGDFARFWEQVVRWAGKPAQSTECEIATDVEGQEATVRVQALDSQGKSLQLAALQGQVLTPEMKSEPLSLTQTGPGQYLRAVPGPGLRQLHRQLALSHDRALEGTVPPGECDCHRALRAGVSRLVRQCSADAGSQPDHGRPCALVVVRPECRESVRLRRSDLPADAAALVAAADAGMDRYLPAGCGGPACGGRCAGDAAPGQRLADAGGATRGGPNDFPPAGPHAEAARTMVRPQSGRRLLSQAL